MRICSLLPAATEILFALGLEDQIVAVSHECDYPPAARSKPQVTTGLVDADLLSSAEIDEIIAEALTRGHRIYHIDMEVLRSAKPDLIVTQELCTVCAVDGREVRLAATQLQPVPQVVSLEPASITDLLGCIRMLGDWTGSARRAEQLIVELSARLARVTTAVEGVPRPRVLCLEWLDPAWVAGHWMPEVVALAGGTDVLGGAGAPSRRATWAEIAAAEPNVAILMPCGFGVERTLREVDLLLTVPQIEALPAFQSGEVYAVDGSAYYNRAGPRMVDGVELLAALLHPDVFPRPLPPEAVLRLAAPFKADHPPTHLKFEPIGGSRL